MPLTVDENDVIRITGSRITLDSIVESFQDGATPEEIAVQYPALSLPVVYSVISYYLQNQATVIKYLHKQNELRANAVGIRARLLARQKHQG